MTYCKSKMVFVPFWSLGAKAEAQSLLEVSAPHKEEDEPEAYMRKVGGERRRRSRKNITYINIYTLDSHLLLGALLRSFVQVSAIDVCDCLDGPWSICQNVHIIQLEKHKSNVN